MKRLFLFFLLLLSSLISQAQDVIYTRDHRKIKCKVIEVGRIDIRYSDPEKQVIFSIAVAEVVMIEYANGEFDYFDSPEASLPAKEKNPGFKDVRKNILNLVPSDIFRSQLSLSYQRISNKGNIGVLFLTGAGLLDNFQSYRLGFDFNIFPYGQKKFSYLTGIGTRFSSSSTRYSPYHSDISWILINNGLNIAASSDFNISLLLGIGVTRQVTRHDFWYAGANFEFSLGWRF